MSSFEFVSRWDREREWMDIGFRATEAHTVAVPGLEVELPFQQGEPLRFEISAKFRREGVERELAAAGFSLDAWWTDPDGDVALALVSGSANERERSTM